MIKEGVNMLKINFKLIMMMCLILLASNLLLQSKPNEKELAVFKDELEKKVNIKIDQEPLEEFFIRLRKICKIPIVTSSKIHLQKNIQIAFSDTAVKDIIFWVCQKYELDFEIKKDALYFLALDEFLKNNVIFKTYDIKYLQHLPMQDNSFFSSPVDDIYGGNAGLILSKEDDEGDPILYVGKALDRIIKNKIPDGHWDSNETLIEIKGSSLRVKNLPEVQEKVETILKYYFEKFGVQVHSEVKIFSVPKKEFNDYLLNELNNSNILSAEKLKDFLNKKIQLWQKQKLLFSGSTVSYNTFSTKISINTNQDSLVDFAVVDAEYDPTLRQFGSEEGVSITPLINKNQSEIILTIQGQFTPTLEVITPKLNMQNSEKSIDKIQIEVARFATSAQIKNGGGILISMGSNAFKEIGDQLLVFCITSKISKK